MRAVASGLEVSRRLVRVREKPQPVDPCIVAFSGNACRRPRATFGFCFEGSPSRWMIGHRDSLRDLATDEVASWEMAGGALDSERAMRHMPQSGCRRQNGREGRTPDRDARRDRALGRPARCLPRGHGVDTRLRQRSVQPELSLRAIRRSARSWRRPMLHHGATFGGV
jgi:hypothetical protein